MSVCAILYFFKTPALRSVDILPAGKNRIEENAANRLLILEATFSNITMNSGILLSQTHTSLCAEFVSVCVLVRESRIGSVRVKMPAELIPLSSFPHMQLILMATGQLLRSIIVGRGLVRSYKATRVAANPTSKKSPPVPEATPPFRVGARHPRLQEATFIKVSSYKD